MEDTAYNRRIANQVRALNQQYIKDYEMKGYLLEDMPITKPVVKRGADFEGSGFLSSVLGSIGLGKKAGAMTGGLDYAKIADDLLGSVGLGKKAGAYMRGGAMSGGAMTGAGFLDTLGSLAPLAMLALGKPKKGGIATGGRRGRPRKMAGIATGGAMSGSGFLDDLAGVAQNVGSTALSLAPLLALGKKGKRKGAGVALDYRDENFATPSASGRRRRRRGGIATGGIATGGIATGGIATGGIQTGGLSRKLLGARAVGSGMAELEGAGFFDDVLSGINKTIGVASQAKALHSMLKGKGKKTAGIATGGKRGRPRKMAGIETGGAMEGSGLFDDILGKVSDTLGTVAQGAQLAKQFGFLKGKGKKGMMKAGVATGGKRGASPWIAHIKAYAKKHGMKYNEALKDPNAKASYKK